MIGSRERHFSAASRAFTTSSLLLADAQRLAHALRFASARSQHSPRPTVSYLRRCPVVCSERAPSVSPAPGLLKTFGASCANALAENSSAAIIRIDFI